MCNLFGDDSWSWERLESHFGDENAIRKVESVSNWYSKFDRIKRGASKNRIKN